MTEQGLESYLGIHLKLVRGKTGPFFLLYEHELGTYPTLFLFLFSSLTNTWFGDSGF